MKLGYLSSKYETGNNGPATVSSGNGDAGGISYGSYQMIAATVKQFVGQHDFFWHKDFKELTPCTKQFTDCWIAIANNNHDRFVEAEHNFIKATHYDKLVAKVLDEDVINLDERHDAVKQVVWSVAVQHGPGSKIIHNAMKTLQGVPHTTHMFDELLIKAIYAERRRKDSGGNLVWFSKNSAAVQKGVSNRFIAEEKDALEMLANQ